MYQPEQKKTIQNECINRKRNNSNNLNTIGGGCIDQKALSVKSLGGGSSGFIKKIMKRNS